MKLEIELIPQTAWGENLRSMFTASQWTKIRNAVYKKYNNKCTICGAEKGKDIKRLNAHEVWEFDDKTNKQILVNIIAVCDRCHGCIHYGRTQQTSKELNDPSILERINEHYMKINNCDEAKLTMDIFNAKLLWMQRSTKKWELDISKVFDIVDI